MFYPEFEHNGKEIRVKNIFFMALAFGFFVGVKSFGVKYFLKCYLANNSS